MTSGVQYAHRVFELAATVVPGPPALAELHARELPQKDNLCGAFWGALVLRSAGMGNVDGSPIDQDLVAVRAGTTLPAGDPATFVPAGVPSRQDYRLPIAIAAEAARSGTSAPALARALEDLSGGALAVVPVVGPWRAESVLRLLEAARSAAPGSVLLANIRSGALWGSKPSAATLLAHLTGAHAEPPPPDWDVGHFAALIATLRGGGGAFVLVRDTYATLGWGGHHLQPPQAVAAALLRGDGREGGVLCVCPSEEVDALRSRLEEDAYELRHWDNGTPDPVPDGKAAASSP